MGFILGVLALLGRLMIATIFLVSAVGKVPTFAGIVEGMKAKGIQMEGFPLTEVLLAGAIAFMILGGISVAIGFKARLGAFLLLVFLAAATYYYHDFWNLPGEEQQNQLIQFMKNLALGGTMVFILAVGAGPGSIDAAIRRRRELGADADETASPGHTAA